MTNEDLESCLTAVEAEVAPLKTHGEQNTTPDADTWLDVVFGAFKDDPLFDEAERYGREWRNSQQAEDENVFARQKYSVRCVILSLQPQ